MMSGMYLKGGAFPVFHKCRYIGTTQFGAQVKNKNALNLHLDLINTYIYQDMSKLLSYGD